MNCGFKLMKMDRMLSYIIQTLAATLVTSLRDVWRIKQPLRGCFMLILNTSCLAVRKIFISIMDIGLNEI